MKFIKYKQVARITLYGFDDLYRNNTLLHINEISSKLNDLISFKMNIYKQNNNK